LEEITNVLMIRLSRAGGKNRPFYRVVVIDSRKQRDGRSVEEIGYYNPLEDPVVVNVDRDKVAYWTERGAQLSDSVRTLLKRENSVHTSRRGNVDFSAAVPDEAKPKKTARKPAKAEAEVATAVAEAPEPEAAEATEPAAPEAAAPAEGEEA
jgi:small subunit ribosomal protein S16